MAEIFSDFNKYETSEIINFDDNMITLGNPMNSKRAIKYFAVYCHIIVFIAFSEKKHSECLKQQISARLKWRVCMPPWHAIPFLKALGMLVRWWKTWMLIRGRIGLTK